MRLVGPVELVELVGPVELVGEADFTGMFFTSQPSGSFWDD